MLYLKQSTTSQAVLLGPFVDDTDGATAETGLTIANTDIRLSANGGNMFAKTSGGGTHDEAGWYTITLDATDTATVGRLQISCKVAGALHVFIECQVLEEAVFDRDFASGATGVDADWTDAGRLDTLLDAIPTTAMRGTDSAALATVCTEARLAELDAANLPADVDTINTATGGLAGAAMRGTDGANTVIPDVAGTASTHSAADVWTAGTRTLTDPAGFKKNTTASLAFVMFDTTDGKTPIASKTVTATRSIDGAAFGACANAVVEIANGAYTISLDAADLNGDIIILRFTSAGADDHLITIKTET